MNIHPDTTLLTQCAVYKMYPEHASKYIARYMDNYYPDYLNLPVGKTNFLYIVPLLYPFVIEMPEDFCLFIPDDIISQVYKGEGKILIDYSDEWYNLYVMNELRAKHDWATNSLSQILSTIKKYNLSRDQVIVLNSNKHFHEVEHEHFQGATVIKYEGVHLPRVDSDYLVENIKRYKHREHRSHRLLTTMGHCRYHKLAIAKHVYNNDYLKNNYMSLYMDIPEPQSEMEKTLPWILDTDTDILLTDDNQKVLIKPGLYKFALNSYVEFCVGTSMMDNALSSFSNQPCDKIYLSILKQKPFIHCGTKDSLKHLKDTGYKTFSELWDESYDDENETERLNKLLKLYDQFNRCSDNEIAEICYKAIPIIEHNFNQYIENFHNKINLRYFKI